MRATDEPAPRQVWQQADIQIAEGDHGFAVRCVPTANTLGELLTGIDHGPHLAVVVREGGHVIACGSEQFTREDIRADQREIRALPGKW